MYVDRAVLELHVRDALRFAEVQLSALAHDHLEILLAAVLEATLLHQTSRVPPEVLHRWDEAMDVVSSAAHGAYREFVGLPGLGEFSEHLADLGVPNSTGSFRLIPLDQRPPFTGDTPPTCTTAAEFLDGILAVVLTRGDDNAQIRRYAETITREVTRWANS